MLRQQGTTELGFHEDVDFQHRGYVLSKTRLNLTPQTSWLVPLCLLVATITLGYLRLSTSFAPYDDEGYVIVSLKSFMSGRPLYDATYTQYGPGYFFLSSWFHQITGLNIDHDTMRFRMLFVWVLTSVSAGIAVSRLTQSRWLGLVGYAAAWFHLDRLGFEPGHPQDLCFVAIALSLLTATGNTRRRWHFLALGTLAGVTVMTKINIGVFLFIMATVTALVEMPATRLRNGLLVLFATGAAILPLAIAKQNVLTFAGCQLPVVVGLGWIALAVSFCRFRSEKAADSALLALKNTIAVWTTFAGCVAFFCSLAIANGTSMQGLWFGLVGQHHGNVEHFYEHPPLFWFSFVVGVAGVFCSIALSQRPLTARRITLSRLVAYGFVVLLAGVGFRYVTDSITTIDHGGNDRGHAALLLSIVPAFAWLLIARPAHSAKTKIDPARIWLAVACVVMPMCPYPIPGTQMAMAAFPLIIVALVVVSDMRGWLQAGDDRLVCARTLIAVGVVCVMSLSLRAVHLGNQFASMVPLNLPGARHLRLSQDFVEATHWTIDELRRRNATTFVRVHSGHNSLYAWSDPVSYTHLTLPTKRIV